MVENAEGRLGGSQLRRSIDSGDGPRSRLQEHRLDAPRWRTERLPEYGATVIGSAPTGREFIRLKAVPSTEANDRHGEAYDKQNPEHVPMTQPGIRGTRHVSEQCEPVLDAGDREVWWRSSETAQKTHPEADA